jgi:alginate O-acetyltransferase complex protein AlgI
MNYITLVIAFCVLIYLFAYWKLLKVWRIPSLVFISLGLISWYDWRSALFVLLQSVIAFLIGRQIERSKTPRAWLICGLVVLVSSLGFFKYLGLFDQFITLLGQLLPGVPHLIISQVFLPIGISFYTFRNISYLMDLYWKVGPSGTFTETLCYNCMFPTFIAGPIDRFHRLLNAFHNLPDLLSPIEVEKALKRILIGAFRKFVIADWLGYWLSPVWQQEHCPLGLKVIALLGFSVQIYMDFAGYSDIAIGAARLFGLPVMENFKSPYFSTNIAEFWTRWHISLSSWIRDYLFFPLSSASASKTWQNWFVPIIAMGLCGLWHGASVRFILWGLWHGLGIAVYQYWRRLQKRHKVIATWKSRSGYAFAAGILTFIFVTYGWSFFV